MRRLSKLNAIVCAMIFATAISASAKQGEAPNTAIGGQAVRGDLTTGLEADLRNNGLQGHFAGAEKRAGSNDGPGQKLAQVKLTPRQTKQIFHPLLKQLEPELQQLFKRSPSLEVPKPLSARPEQGLRQPPSDPFLTAMQSAAERAAAENAASEKTVAQQHAAADETQLLALGASALGVIILVGLVVLWQQKRGGAAHQTTVATSTAVSDAATDGKDGLTIGDIVNCSVFAPPRVARGAKFTVQAHLHVPRDIMKVVREAIRIDATANRLGDKQLPLPVPRGANVELFLEFDKDLIIRQALHELTWQGAPAKVEFEVEVPANLVAESFKGRLTLEVDRIPVGDIEFKLHVTTAENVSTGEAAETYVLKYNNAFVSYSRKDFHEVSLFAQALTTTGMKLLVDVTAIEPGDDWARKLPVLIGQADVFLLVWSENASNSEWVDKEARHAKTLYDTSDSSRPRIFPMTLERPMPDPPDYLSKISFHSFWADLRAAHRVPLFDKSLTGRLDASSSSSI
jgi:hypothetical protein